jgi:hypothetical protein
MRSLSLNRLGWQWSWFDNLPPAQYKKDLRPTQHNNGNSQRAG